MISRKTIALLGLCCWSTAGLLAQEAQPPLRDPTRPPEWQGVPGDETGTAELRLEAIKRGPEGQRLATIAGMNLHVGQEVRGMRLVRIDAAAVLLEGPEGRQELRLTPDVQAPVRRNHAAGGK